jgi:endoglycosylceramidase
MHQDAYSKEIGEDGAPLWAIVPPPTELLGGPLTDLSDRRLSAQVLAAFDTFFGDSAEGAALRTRLVAAASHVMERFSDDPAVIGFEIFNEPQATSAGIERLNASAYPALRDAAPNKLYLFEPSATRNLTDIAPIPDAPLGPMVGYAPHVYTLAFVGDDAAHQAMTKETLRRSNANARTEADAWQAPLIVTEWGYDPNGIQASAYFRWQSELQDEYGASSFFWVWKEESQGSWGCFDHDAATDSWTPRAAVRDALARVRPARVAGWPESVRFDRQSGELELDFRGNPRVKADHEIAIAPALGAPLVVSCDGAPADYSSLDYGAISVRCARGKSGAHVLRVMVAPQTP